jgi:hypothetical protein
VGPRVPDDVSRDPPDPERIPRNGLFAANLVLTLVLGVGASAWLLAYTDWFPAIGGLLALGGAFSWIAFVSGALRDERKKGFQQWLEEQVLTSRVATVLILVLIATGVVVVLCTGSVTISSLQDTPALVTYYPNAADSVGDTLDVQPRASHCRPVWVGRVGGPRRMRLLAQGLPDLVIDVRGSERRAVTVPYSFLRPVLLLRPSAAFIDQLGEEKGTLKVKTNNSTWSLSKFKGRPVWIGCTADVEVPQRIRDSWSSEHVDQASDLVHGLWASPMSLPGPRIDLTIGQRVEVSFEGEEGHVMAQGVYTVRRVARLADFPQVEALDVR